MGPAWCCFFFLLVLGMEPKPHTCEASTVSLKHTPVYSLRICLVLLSYSPCGSLQGHGNPACTSRK
jgi:hypothetical protein